jgi:ribosomal protein S18 acetylase RimI-like enzyme
MELESAVSLGRVIVAEDNGTLLGWLRWNLFWDNTPFMNMLFILDRYRSCGYGRKMVAYWENQMKTKGYDLVMTSSLSNEAAQHFYRKLNYVDSGALLLPEEPLEIIFVKKL